MHRPSILEIEKILYDHQKYGKLADFSNMNLSGMAFQGRDLSRAKFSGADCNRCSFRFCNLENASFTDTDISGADFYRAVIYTTAKGKGVYIDSKEKDRPSLTIDQIETYSHNTIINLDDCYRLFWG